MNFAIESKNLSKSYDQVVALRDLTLQIAPGIVYGLLGPNGAGKSTLLQMLLGFLRSDKGSLRVLGSSDLNAARAQIGYLPQTPAYNTRATAREYLHFLGRLHGLRGAALSSRVVEELEAFELSAIADRSIDSYTRPALQRLGFAQALLKRPALLLLDEPTAGTEAEDRTAIIDILTNLRSRVPTIVLATHNLGEAELLSDRVGILANGQLMVDVNVADMRGSGRNVLITVQGLSDTMIAKLCSLHPAVQCSSYEVALQPNSPQLQALVLSTLLSAGIPIISLEPFGRPLEDLYVQAIQGTLPPAQTATAHSPAELVAPSEMYITQPIAVETNELLLNELLAKEPITKEE